MSAMLLIQQGPACLLLLMSVHSDSLGVSHTPPLAVRPKTNSQLEQIVRGLAE